MNDPITDFLPDVDEYLERQSLETLNNLSLGDGFGLPVILPTSDPARVPFLSQFQLPTQQSTGGQQQGAPSTLPQVQAGGAPAAAYKRFSARGSGGLTLAEKQAVAQWMAGQAQARGFPPELPVMASLTETGDTLRNLLDGDRDSVGFFQIRVSIHGSKSVATPEAQLQWFLFNANRAPLGRSGRAQNWDRKFFEQQISAARARQDSGQLALWLGRWCQDTERSAYPDRYQQRYALARKLIDGR